MIKTSFSPIVYGILKAFSTTIGNQKHLETFGLKQNLYFVIKQKLGALKRFNIFAIVCMHFLKKK
jgi:hypothetical protein